MLLTPPQLEVSFSARQAPAVFLDFRNHCFVISKRFLEACPRPSYGGKSISVEEIPELWAYPNGKHQSLKHLQRCSLSHAHNKSLDADRYPCCNTFQALAEAGECMLLPVDITVAQPPCVRYLWCYTIAALDHGVPKCGGGFVHIDSQCCNKPAPELWRHGPSAASCSSGVSRTEYKPRRRPGYCLGVLHLAAVLLFGMVLVAHTSCLPFCMCFPSLVAICPCIRIG